jgi:heat shock factor-binding protein 1
MSEAIIGRIDEMGTRIDDLEHSIGDLMQQAGIDEGDVGGGAEGQKAVEDE